MKIAPSFQNQSGQTLVETVVAIFILITGLVSAVSLAIYSFQSTDTSTKQIVATGLAREGSEAIKNIRDSNWLDEETVDDCDNGEWNLGVGQKCYRRWQGTGSDQLIGNPAGGPAYYAVNFNPSTRDWVITRSPGTYALNYDATSGRYMPAIGGATGSRSIYSRRVSIEEMVSGTYTAKNPLLKVTTIVWWFDRRCPATTDPNTLPNSCKVVLETSLTNWKNY